jgi:hypothetical protein
VEDVRLGVLGQADGLGIAPALEVEDAVLVPVWRRRRRRRRRVSE